MAERGILARCEAGHEQRLLTPDYDASYAAHLAGVMDGTSPFYACPPRQYPVEGSTIAHCALPGCGAWITCTLFGYPA